MGYFYKNLNANEALIFRIVHRENLPRLLQAGLSSRNGAQPQAQQQYIEIGNSELIAKRLHRGVECPPGGTLGDYVPFYFTPFSPMLYNIYTGYNGIRQRSNEEILILITSLHRLRELGVQFVFTDRHAYLLTAQFSSDLADLNWIDWPSLQTRTFKKSDIDKFERYQAEALVYKAVPAHALFGIACYNDSAASYANQQLQAQNLNISVKTLPGWYFQ